MGPSNANVPKTLKVLEQGIAEGLHLGAQLFISHQGEVVADVAVGEARPGLAMRTDTSQFWFSCSKPLAAVAMGQFLEQHKLLLEDRVAEFIPEFAQGGKEEVTLSHVLTHTGGFRGSDHIRPEWTWDEVVAFACKTPLEQNWIPGERAGYHHTTSWYLLGEIIQRLDGRSYSNYVRDELFEPLGMTDSWIGMRPEVYRELGDRLGSLFQMGQGQSSPTPYWGTEYDSTVCRPGSNGRGPVRELGRLFEMLLHRGQGIRSPILKPDTVDILTARRRQGMYDETFMQYIDWGLGLLLCTRHSGQRLTSYGFGEHASLRAFGHGGMQSSIAFADPDHDLVVAWVCNGLCGERLHRQRNHALNTAIYEDLGLMTN